MRCNWAIYALVVAFAVVIPLFPPARHYASFLRDVSRIPLSSAHPHIKHSASAVKAALAAAMCVSLPIPVIPVVCPALTIEPDDAMFDDLISSQLALYGGTTRILTHNEPVALFMSVVEAAQFALAVDDLILLAEDGGLQVRGVGNITLVVEIYKESVATALAGRNVLIHAELSATL
ncbi:hypothetical protein C8Q80DRAFT_1275547 [Daedaleopsis nitida]|nr:hypothetical protein C8Q80DRAFT_1275547 [Daedaleopsis nitida]